MDMKRWELVFLSAAVVLVFVWSAIRPFDRLVWFLEAFPVIVVAVLLLASRRSLPLTMLLYRLIALHAVILLVGAHYAYARVPPGLWFQELFDLSRNHYDRLGHLAQGFIPAIAAREILLRRSPLVAGRWLFFLVLCVCLAFSAFYELVEWWVALLDSGQSSAEFLGSQGDEWDTQWDMFLALLGAVVSLLLLSTRHDRALRKLGQAGKRQH